MLSLPTSTPNCCVYLEFGVISIIYEMKKQRLVYFHNFIKNNQHMIQNIELLQSSMLKRNNACQLNEIFDDIILFDLVKSNISEIFILHFEQWKKTVYTNIALQAFTELNDYKNKKRKFQHLNYEVDAWKCQVLNHIYYLSKLILHQEICFQPNTNVFIRT